MGWTPPAAGARATWTKTFTANDAEAFARLTEVLTGTCIVYTMRPTEVP